MATDATKGPKRRRRRRNRHRPPADCHQRQPIAAVIYGEGQELEYRKGCTIRALPINGVLHFALPDCLDALGYSQSAEAVVAGPDFPTFARTVCDEAPDPSIPGKPQEVTLLSPVGVWFLTALTDACHGQRLSSWARREAMLQCPTAPPGDRALTLTRLDDGTLPPYPTKHSGWKSAWCKLKEDNPRLDWALRRQGGADSSPLSDFARDVLHPGRLGRVPLGLARPVGVRL